MKWVVEKHCCPTCKNKSREEDIIALFLETSANQKVIDLFKKKSDEQIQSIRKQLRLERKKRRNLETELTSLKNKIDEYLTKDDVVPITENEKNHRKRDRQDDDSQPALKMLRTVSSHIDGINFDKPLDAVVAAQKMNNNTTTNTHDAPTQYKHQYRIRRELAIHDTASVFDFLNDPSSIVFDNKKLGNLTIFNMTKDALDEAPLLTPEEKLQRTGRLPIRVTDMKCMNSTNSYRMVYVTCNDQSARTLDLRCKTVSYKFDLKSDALCCVFDDLRPHLMYCGMRDGRVQVLDIRKNDAELNTIQVVQQATDTTTTEASPQHNNMISSLCTLRDGSLLIGHAKTGAYHCSKSDSTDYALHSLSNKFSLKSGVDYCYHVGFDPYSSIGIASYASTRSHQRNIDHFLFKCNFGDGGGHFQSNHVQMLRTLSEPTIDVPERFQPNMLQCMGVEDVVFKSPTLLYSTGCSASSLPVDDDDDIVCIDPRIEAGNINTLVAYSKYKKAAVIDSHNSHTFQQLASNHTGPLTCLRYMNHSVGHFLAQLSLDRFTLYTLGLDK
ncbi:myosin heavy chain [Acrasis kona]|uniref:Myosin heavy chain n=1 Tax=Acrasis kona TaxID=1008807 RepID=A0AAW2YMX4_9EUKA